MKNIRTWYQVAEIGIQLAPKHKYDGVGTMDDIHGRKWTDVNVYLDALSSKLDCPSLEITKALYGDLKYHQKAMKDYSAEEQ